MLQEKLKASPKPKPPAKLAPLKSIKPPEWPSPQPSPYPQPRPQPPREPQTPQGVERTAVSTWSHREPQSAETRRTLVDPPKLKTLQYWSFSSAGIYNWKINHPLSQDPQCLTGLVEFLMFSHQPTWDDCQQQFQMLLTTEKPERILLEARKIARKPTGSLHSYKMRSTWDSLWLTPVGTATWLKVGRAWKSIARLRSPRCLKTGPLIWLR